MRVDQGGFAVPFDPQGRDRFLSAATAPRGCAAKALDTVQP